MNKKVIFLIVIFLLLVPFRLPIAVLFINLISYIATIAADLNDKILVANVIVTKLIYDLVLGIYSVYNIERLTIQLKGRGAYSGSSGYESDESFYWWTGVIGFLMICYIIFDCCATYDLYYILNK